MLSQKRKLQAEYFGVVVASDLFSTMLNSKYRGDAFTWDALPDMVKEHIEVQFPVSYGKIGNKSKEMIAVAQKAGISHAERCIKNAGLKLTGIIEKPETVFYDLPDTKPFIKKG